MRIPANISFLVRGAIAALVVMIAGGLLSGLAGLSPEAPSVGAAPLAAASDLHPTSLIESVSSLAVSGDMAILGSAYDDAAGKATGAAYVFQRDQGGANNWGEVKKLLASDGEAGDYFGNSAAISGDIAVVGMWDSLGPNTGAAYVFQRDQGGVDNWGEVKKLTSLDAATGDNFGWSVGISGDTIVVGARYQDGAASNAGAAYVFQRDEGGTDNWGEVRKLTASDAEASDFLGQSVAVSGNTAIVGAMGEDSGGFAAGAAYVYQRDQGGTDNWGEVKKLTASNTEAFDNFGYTVGVSGDNAVVGIHDSLAPKVGEVYVFQQDHGGTDNWGEARRLTTLDSNQWFGKYIAISGSTIVLYDAGGDRVLRQHEGGANNWGEIAQLTEWGRGAISGGTVVVSGGSAGYVFDLPPKFTPTPCAPEGCPTQTPTSTPTFTPTPPAEVQKLVASDAVPYGNFSFRNVTVDGDTLAAGASSGAGNHEGYVYVFERSQGGASSWGEIKKIDSPTGPSGSAFGASVSISGDTMVVGAQGEIGGPGLTGAGAAYIFQRDTDGANNWGQVARLTATDPEYLGWFGHDVSISGDIVIVGAFGDDAGGESAGAAHIFHRNAGGPDNWGEIKKLTASDALADDNFGWDVSVSGDAAIIGGRRGDQGGEIPAGPGVAYVFERNAGGADNWGQVKQLTVGSNSFGQSVSISGEAAIVGKMAGSGRAYVYERHEGGISNWGQVAELGESDASLNFGSSVAISGLTAVVGARGDDGSSPTEGAAFVFQRNEGGSGAWGLVTKLTAFDAAADDEFGHSAAVSADTTVIGAHLEDEGGTNAGAAYVFDLTQIGTPTPTITQAPSDTPTPTSTPTDTPTPTATPTPGPDADGDGCSDLREGGPDETLGGMRDWLNPNDFYDVLGPGSALPIDGIIDLPNDILGVIQHFSPSGAPPYDVQFDRGPSSGPNAWNMTAPDGVIDLPNDILGVITQFNHSCHRWPAG